MAVQRLEGEVDHKIRLVRRVIEILLTAISVVRVAIEAQKTAICVVGGCDGSSDGGDLRDTGRYAPFKIRREITKRRISLVPSPISQSLASRHKRSTGNSLE